ncbi:MAG: ligase-associated DNA damage response exonuclease [Aggregatilineales bacterium]
MSLISATERGFYCAAGDFYIDPWQPVTRAVITHGHADHFARGCGAYLVAGPGEAIFRLRLGQDAHIETLAYGERRYLNDVIVSLHPAGHILGSAQVRVEHRGEVWVVSGDYKREPDPTCAPFEVVPCHTFVTEATFGLPIYRWPPQAQVFAQINDWWGRNQAQGRASILFGYALGKAQRIMAGIDPLIGPIYTHGAVEALVDAYRAGGIAMPPTTHVMQAQGAEWQRALIIAPPSARGTPWLRRFGDQSSGFVSGWMRIRGTRRRRAVDRGFVLSDHADWTDLMTTIRETGAEQVWVTHGYTAAVTRHLREQGIEAYAVETRYTGENDDSAVDEPPIETIEG